MFFISLFLLGQLCRTSGFIDIPTVPQYDTKGMWGGSMVLSMRMFGTNPYPPTDSAHQLDPADFDLVFKYGLGKTELALAAFTPTTWVISVSHLIKPEKNGSIAIFTGVDDISYNAHISTLGMGGADGTIEERGYNSSGGKRPVELFSAYIAMQKSFGSMVSFVAGLGRGRFVGNSWRSHIFNTDLFITGSEYNIKPHSWWALGLFMGGELKFPFGLDLSVEMDGRDANLGLKYHAPIVTVTLALCKLEYIGSFRPWSPRWTFGLEGNNRSALGPPNIGSIQIIVQDVTSKEMLTDGIIDIREINKRYKAPSGAFKISLPVGNYTLAVSKPNYVDYIGKVSIKPGVTTKAVFNLQKTEEALQRELAVQQRDQSIKTSLAQGKTYYSEGNLIEAKKAFETVVSLDPENVEAKNLLTNIESRRLELINAYITEARKREKANDNAKAIEYYQKALDLDPQNAEYAQALTALKTKKTTTKTTTTTTKKPPATTKPKEPVKKVTTADIETLYQKGTNYFLAEKYDQALKVFKQILALDPNHKGAKDYKKRTEARIKALKGG